MKTIAQELRAHREAMLRARQARLAGVQGFAGGRIGSAAPNRSSRRGFTDRPQPMPEPLTSGNKVYGQSQLLVLQATSQSLEPGGDYVTFDAVEAVEGFVGGGLPSPPAASWTHPQPGVYVAAYRHEWNSYSEGGSVRIEVDGELLPEGRLFSGDDGRIGFGVCLYRAPAGSVGKIKVIHTGALAQSFDASLSIGISDPSAIEGIEGSADWTKVFSGDVYDLAFDGTDWWVTAGNSSDTVYRRSAGWLALDFVDIEMGGRGRGITFDGTHWWVTGNYDSSGETSGGSVLKEYDLAGTLISTIFTQVDLGFAESNSGLAFDGANLWFFETQENRLVEVTPAGALVEDHGLLPFGVQGMHVYDSRLWMVNGKTLRIFDLAGNDTGVTVDLSGLVGTPTGIWITPTGTLYIAVDGDGVYLYGGVLP